MMMGMKTRVTGLSSMNYGGGTTECGAEWEVRPGGMLVQKRNPDSDRSSNPPPTVRVKVKYGSTNHEINISSQASFGDLKKQLTGLTGLHHEDQKLIYKNKERDSKAFLDLTGVKDKSKIVLVKDTLSQERRFLEMRRSSKMDNASKTISEISLEVDRLAGQVSALESVISDGGEVEEKQVVNLIELLMNQLLKLDGIVADGDVKLQRKMQVRKVQKYVETLDMLKIKNSMPNPTVANTAPQKSQQKQVKPSNRQRSTSKEKQQTISNNGRRLAPIEEEHQPMYSVDLLSQQRQQSSLRNSASSAAPVIATTQWETFDSTPPRVPISSTSTSASMTKTSVHQPPKFPWDFFN